MHQKFNIKRLIEAIEKGGNHFHFTIGNRRYYCSLPISKNMGEKYIKEVNKIIKYPKNIKPLTREDIELFNHYKKLWEARIGEELKTEVLDCYKSLDSLIDLALEKWRSRLSI